MQEDMQQMGGGNQNGSPQQQAPAKSTDAKPQPPTRKTPNLGSENTAPQKSQNIDLRNNNTSGSMDLKMDMT